MRAVYLAVCGGDIRRPASKQIGERRAVLYVVHTACREESIGKHVSLGQVRVIGERVEHDRGGMHIFKFKWQDADCLAAVRDRSAEKAFLVRVRLRERQHADGRRHGAERVRIGVRKICDEERGIAAVKGVMAAFIIFKRRVVGGHYPVYARNAVTQPLKLGVGKFECRHRALVTVPQDRMDLRAYHKGLKGLICSCRAQAAAFAYRPGYALKAFKRPVALRVERIRVLAGLVIYKIAVEEYRVGIGA